MSMVKLWIAVAAILSGTKHETKYVHIFWRWTLLDISWHITYRWVRGRVWFGRYLQFTSTLLMCQCKKWVWTEWCPIDFFFGDVEAGYIDWEEGWVRRREVRSVWTDISSYQLPQLQCPLSNLRVKHSEKVQSLFSIYDSELIYSETDEIHTNSSLQ